MTTREEPGPTPVLSGDPRFYLQGVGGIGADVLAQGVGGIGADVLAHGVGGIGAEVLAQGAILRARVQGCMAPERSPVLRPSLFRGDEAQLTSL